jgi:hypothetical protein
MISPADPKVDPSPARTLWGLWGWGNKVSRTGTQQQDCPEPRPGPESDPLTGIRVSKWSLLSLVKLEAVIARAEANPQVWNGAQNDDVFRNGDSISGPILGAEEETYRHSLEF